MVCYVLCGVQVDYIILNTKGRNLSHFMIIFLYAIILAEMFWLV